MAKSRNADCHDIEVSYRDLCDLIETGRVKIDKQITIELGGPATLEDIRDLRDKIVEEVDSQTDILIGGEDEVEDVDDADDDEDAEGEEGEPDEEDEDDDAIDEKDEEPEEAEEVG